MKKNIGFAFDSKAREFMKGFESKLEEGRENATEAMGMVWADEAKMITLNERHVDTSAYVNSIGYETGFSGKEGTVVGEVIHDMKSEQNKTILNVGSGVAYAAALEKKYSILARALDNSIEDMNEVGAAQVRKALFK